MKSTLILLLSTIVCLVKALSMEHVSDSEDFMILQRRFQSDPIDTGNTDAPTQSSNDGGTSSSNKKPVPVFWHTILGNDLSGTTSSPPPGGDFVIQYEGVTDLVHANFGDCVVIQNTEGKQINFVKFRHLVACYIYQDAKCVMLRESTPLPFIGDTPASNLLKLWSSLAESFTCYSYYSVFKEATNVGNILEKGGPTDFNNIGKIKGILPE